MEPTWPRILQEQLLQPIVHPLCRAVQAFGSSQTTVLVVTEHQIASLQSQTQLLDRLATTLRRLPAVLVASTDMQETMTEKERQSLSKFLSLPLRGILRSYRPFVDENDDATTRKRSAPLQSALWKTVAGASHVLHVLLEEWLQPDKMLLVAPFDDEKVRAIELQSFLSVLIEALPDATYIESLQDNNNNNNRRAFDTGHACITSTLRTVQTLLQQQCTTTMVVPWPCVVRLLSTAIALVEPPTTKSKNNNNNDSVVPTSTQLEALRLMLLLLQQLVVRTTTTTDDATTTAVGSSRLRSVFPAVYAGLFRRIVVSLLHTTRQQHQAIVEIAIQCLTQLLEATLSCCCCCCSAAAIRTVGAPPTATQVIDMQQQWLALAAAQNKMENANEDSDEFLQSVSEQDRDFFRQIRLRIPNTLVELVGKLQVANTTRVRHVTVHLLQAVVRTDVRLWGRDSKVPLTLLEGLMILSQDADEDTAQDAMLSLRGYATDHTTSYAIKGWIRERLFALLEQLVVVTRSANQREIDQTLKLLQSYLSVIRPQHRRDFQAGFGSEQASTLLRKALGSLWDVDFGSTTTTQTIVVAGDKQAPSRRHLRYIRSNDTAALLDSVVQSFGEAVGAKRSALLIDAYIAGMYKSAVDRAERGVSFAGESQIQWLHEWIGTLSVVSGLLRGAVVVTPGRSQRMLSKLVRSIVPLLTKAPLWTPLVFHAQSQVPLQTTNGIPNLMQIESSSSGSQAFRGNCLFRCALLDCMGTFIQCLGLEAQSVAVDLLPLVLECSASGETMEVTNSALVLLETLARDGCGLPSGAELVVRHTATTLIPAFRSKIRSAGGVSLTRESIDVDELSRVVLSATKLLEIAIPLIDDAASSCSQDTVQHLRSIVSDFSTRFDYLACKDETDGLVATQFLRLFRSMVEYIHDTRRASIAVTRLGIKAQEQNEMEPWFALLDDFRTDQSKDPSFANDTDSVDADECTYAGLVDEVASDTTFISSISWRCCYLLSHSNLKVQILSCKVLGKCFEFLGWVATLNAVNTENANGPSTAILRQITSCWPTLSKKLRSLSSAVPASQRSSLLVVPGMGGGRQVAPSDDESRVFLVSLLDLLRVTTRVSGDFMASRLKEIVIPAVQTLLSKLGTKSSDGSGSNRSGVPRQRSQSHLHLLLATIDLITGIFGNQETGLLLSGIIPSLGTSLIPCLQDTDPCVVSATSDALKSLILVDGDSLYSLLLISSGLALRHRPWEGLIHVPSPKGSCLNSEPAKHLLMYLKDLPEKSIW